MGLEVLKGTSTTVVSGLVASGLEGLQGGESTHGELRAEVTVLSAVNVTDNVLALVLGGECGPGRGHALAVATPRCVELHEGVLSLDVLVEVVGGQVNAHGEAHHCQENECADHFSVEW